MNINENIELYNEDCMEVMKRYPDNHFDLAIVDPPYGIGASSMQLGKGVGTDSRIWTDKKWDDNTPKKEYFEQLKRVSKGQIIWGGNYYIDFLSSTNCLLIWDKMQEFSGATFETAWTNFKTPSKAFRLSRVQAYTRINKIHPTQKPVALYKWLLKNYAKPDQKILDTHLGSGSIVIALEDMNKIEKMNLSFVGCELDKEYFEASIKRIKEQTIQLSLL